MVLPSFVKYKGKWEEFYYIGELGIVDLFSIPVIRARCIKVAPPSRAKSLCFMPILLKVFYMPPRFELSLSTRT